jgi:hydrogenase nickel incorporation protein HypA/HybF
MRRMNVHEVSIALGMVEELTRIAEENNAKQITSVRLRIGKMSGIVADSLKFAFDAVKLEHPLLTSAEIQINEVPLVYQCSECNTTFEADDIYFPSCKNCESYNLKIISGREQHIDNVEVEV